ncbi:DUF4286 family protein [Alteribacillus sp. YIM 98480]|uniref:DUF4286 family protein n=1 Tax=Alteribacillus sp. YIM 98480 TaxID=2606599 RepID=UPI00131AE696|nr:DUF4286 family protein [Alteribacillus sp. YIM 98480]
MFDKGQAMLLWALECQADMAPEWNEWYNLEHLPALLRVPGFLSGNRYEKCKEFSLSSMYSNFTIPQYLSFYELYDENVLQSEAYHMNRNSQAPDMRPEWTKRMLTYITKIMGGTYTPRSEIWLKNPEQSVENLLAIYLEPSDNGLGDLDQWYADRLLPCIQKSGILTASRLLGTQSSVPKVKGGVQQYAGPRRIVLTAMREEVRDESLSFLQEAWEEGRDYIGNAAAVSYYRMPLSRRKI